MFDLMMIRCAESRPGWVSGEEPTERMSKAERQRLDFEAERLRWQEERKKNGQTAQRAANVRLRTLFLTCENFPP